MNIPLTPIRFLRYAEQQFPNKTGVVCGNVRLTYAQFADRARRLAGGLQSLGVAPGDRVAFLSLNCHRLIEAYYGVLEAGAVLLPLNIRLAPHELAFILRDAGVKILFVGKEFLDLADAFRKDTPGIEDFVLLEGVPQAEWLAKNNYEEILAAAKPVRSDFMKVDEDSVAELFYTSGTSANPKGVMLTHRNVYLHAMCVALAFDTRLNSVELHTIPLFHANGWGVAHSLTLQGGTHVMVQRFETREVFRLIQDEKVQSCSLVPTMATALVNCPERSKYNLSTLNRVVIGGAASSPTLVREVEQVLGCTCFSGYGLTETSPMLSISPMKPWLRWEGDQRYAGQAMTGYAAPAMELRIVDANDVDVAHDGVAIGEIVARTDGVMKGYWGDPEATREALRGGWFHTGDMATINEEGYILIVDRKKDIIVSGGENISSLEIEKALLAHPSVYEIAVVPVPDERWGEVPKALVVLKPGLEATEAELLEFCRTRVARYKAPRTVEFLESLPKTGTGKILKKELRKKYWQGRETMRPQFAADERKVSS
ncbi:MAG TPA: long-chain-fatty-acid--CoA ligase [Candidatus Acidoferrales bacterium]|nr:long-chain-fatty-acid--CoA ligase [Candidatus Acidoferrales bacterium]